MLCIFGTTASREWVLLSECREFADKVRRGEATLFSGEVDIVPPDPLARPDGSLPLKVVR